jgi:CheY-like chemotaxis protein
MPVVIWIDNADKRQAISQYVRAFGAMPIVLENDQDISSWLQQFQLYEGTIAVLTHYQSKHGAILQQMRDNPFIPALYVIGLEKEGVDYLEHAISANTGQDFHAAYDIVLDEAFHMSAVKKALELANPDPFHDDVNWQKVAEKKSQLPAVLCGVHILIVEDNSLNQMIARELLGSFGATCDVVNDGAAACAAVLEDGVSYDLILMDVQMPVMDGYTATAHIRRRIASSDLPIIGLTAHAMSEHERLAEKAGMDGYVAKPIDPRALLGTICRLLGRDPADQSTDGHSKARSAAPQAAALGDTDTHDGQAVNYEMAIGRMLGRRDLYLDVVRKFLKDSASYMQQMWAGWRDHDHDAVIHTVHTLKGLYGTLGAKKAAHYAKQLECAVKSAHAEKAATLIKRLSELHQDVEDELGVLLADQQDDQRITENVCDSNVIEPPAEALSAEVRACIATLTILLAEYDGETIDYVKNNQKYLIAAIGKRQFTDMLDALQGYDFETAQQILQPFVDAGKPAQ